MSGLDQALLQWPALADLRHLDGWTWQRGAEHGDLAEVGLCGWRQVAPSWMEALRVFGPDDAHGIRAMIDGPWTWEKQGTVADVVLALGRLPRPGQPGAPLAPLDVDALATPDPR